MNKLHTVVASVVAPLIIGNSYSNANEVDASRHKALCSSYSSFSPCEVFVYKEFRITATLPRDYLDVNKDAILQLEMCDADARCKPLVSKNLKYIWHDYFLSPFHSVTDYKIRYVSDSNRPRTAILRYINRRAASNFGKALLASVMNLESHDHLKENITPIDNYKNIKETLRPFNW